MTGSTFDGKAGGQPSSCSLTGPDEKGMYTLSVNELFFPGRSLDEFQEVTTAALTERMEIAAPSLQQVPFHGRDDRADYARMAEMAYGSPRDSAIVRETVSTLERQAELRRRWEAEKNPDGLASPVSRPHDVVKQCTCFCHEELGGGVHRGQRCVCNGGEGWSDL